LFCTVLIQDIRGRTSGLFQSTEGDKVKICLCVSVFVCGHSMGTERSISRPGSHDVTMLELTWRQTCRLIKFQAC